MCDRFGMNIDKISLSYKCHSSIGNSLKLEIMMNEVLKTFVQETFAIYSAFYLLEDKKKIVSIGKKIEYDINKLMKNSSENEIIIEKYNEIFNFLIFRLKKSIIIFVYDKQTKVDFIKSMYESFRNKLNISIDSCLNVQTLEEKNRSLEDLTLNLQEKVDEAILLDKKKEKQIFEQLKMSQMGELIGNIAHQWRQPLSIISTATSGMKIKKEMDLLSDEGFDKYTNSVLENVQFLSKTIDEFRDYIKASHREKEIVIQERVKMALSMIESSCELEHIEIIEDTIESEDIQFKLITGELLQVLISIFNNAIEALIQNRKTNRFIKYSIVKNEYTVLITIEDNGGGIDETIIDKIFNPYFTTKHESQGTGIGLYTSYDIIANHLNGKLYVQNAKDGAKFFIELPLFMDYVI